MSKKISLGAAIAFMVIVIAATLSITWVLARREFNSTASNLRERETMYSKLADVDEYVRQNFIGTIPEEGLVNAMVSGYLTGTGDAYAKYYDPVAYAKMKQSYENQPVQIGIVPKMDESGYIIIDEVYPESPAQAAGFEREDLIVRIDETDITAENYADAIVMLYGAAGTKMNVTIRHGVEESTLEMTRRFVEIPSVYSTMLEGSIGLVKIKEFADNTPDQFNKQVDTLIAQGATGLIFDVRGVNTATLDAVVETLDKLLPKGILVSTVDKAGNIGDMKYSDERQVELPMAVLADEKTIGEAELFAAAVRDYNKGKIIGAKTAGKGTMQRIFPMTDGSAIEVTTARYNPPVSPSFDGTGVKPDFDVKMPEGAAAGVLATDPQLKKAAEVVAAGSRAASETGAASSNAVSEPAVSDAAKLMPDAAYGNATPEVPPPEVLKEKIESTESKDSASSKITSPDMAASKEVSSEESASAGSSDEDGEKISSEEEPVQQRIDLEEILSKVDIIAELTFAPPTYKTAPRIDLDKISELVEKISALTFAPPEQKEETPSEPEPAPASEPEPVSEPEPAPAPEPEPASSKEASSSAPAPAPAPPKLPSAKPKKYR